MADDPVRRRRQNLPPAVQAAFVALITTGAWPTGQAGRDLDAFFAKNGPAWHVRHGRKLDIPVLIGQGMSDNLFNLNQGLQNFDRALTPRARARSMLVGYNGGHTLPSVVPPGYATPRRPVLDRARQPELRRARAAVPRPQPQGPAAPG